LFQHVLQIQLGVTIVVGVVFDTEVDARRVVAQCVFDGHLRLADEAEFSTVAVPDGSNLLDVLHGHVRSRIVLTEYEIRAVVLQLETFAQAWLCLESCLMPFCFHVTVERGWSSPCLR
jgi:hypothetical protein